MATTEKSRTRRPEVLVPVLGLVYATLVFVYVMVVTDFSPFSLIFVPFMVAYLVSAYAILRGSRWGYVASAAGSAILLLLESFRIYDLFGAVTLPGEFLSGMTAVMVLLAVFIYSLLGVRQVWRKGALPSPSPRMIPASSLVILLVLGFIVGGIVVGFVAADTERRLLGTSTADITIVPGAGSQTNPQFFSPANFTVKAGSTVTWVNHDGSSHTVTSQGSTLFDSGDVPTGGTFSYKFTQPGTYKYYCTIHPWMTGTIVVTS
jgi:plastocyanin